MNPCFAEVTAIGVLCMSLSLAAFFAFCFIVSSWNARKRRLEEERRPIEDRLADIRNAASFMIEQLQGHLDGAKAEKRRPFDWIQPTLAYYRRLDELASRPDATPAEIDCFADEATSFVRKRWLKGICVGQLARKLADIAHRRNAA